MPLSEVQQTLVNIGSADEHEASSTGEKENTQQEEVYLFYLNTYKEYSRDRLNAIALETFNLSSNQNKFERIAMLYRDNLPFTAAAEFYNSQIGEIVMNNITRTQPDADAFLEILKRTIGQKLNVLGDGMFCYTSDQTPINLKQLGNRFKFNKLKNWSLIAEQLKSIGVSNVKYYTSYLDLKKYYTNKDCSGGSCMRYDFNLPLHPCIVYAHDAKHFADAKGLSGTFNVSDHIKLAVLWDGDKPVARCMVSENNGHKQRSKAQGDRASELTKVLEREGYGKDGYGDVGISGYINMIEIYEGYIMPYVDGCDTVDTDGELHAGDLSTSETNGLANTGVYSEWHEEYIPEDQAIWSDLNDSWLWADKAVELAGGGWAHPDSDFVCYSEYDDNYYDIDDCIFSEALDIYLPADDADEILIDRIKDGLDSLDFQDLDEILQKYI